MPAAWKTRPTCAKTGVHVVTRLPSFSIVASCRRSRLRNCSSVSWIGLPRERLEAHIYIISGVVPVVALTTIVALLLLGVFRGFHGKDMDDGLVAAAAKEAVKHAAEGQD